MWTTKKSPAWCGAGFRGRNQMSIQIKRLMEKYPQVIESISFEGNRNGDGTWIYLFPSWYSDSTDTGTIHEYTIQEVVEQFKGIYQDKERWIAEHHHHPSEFEDHKRILSGEFDCPELSDWAEKRVKAHERRMKKRSRINAIKDMADPYRWK
jgi:hypothetical protein